MQENHPTNSASAKCWSVSAHDCSGTTAAAAAEWTRRGCTRRSCRAKPASTTCSSRICRPTRTSWPKSAASAGPCTSWPRLCSCPTRRSLGLSPAASSSRISSLSTAWWARGDSLVFAPSVHFSAPKQPDVLGSRAALPERFRAFGPDFPAARQDWRRCLFCNSVLLVPTAQVTF